MPAQSKAQHGLMGYVYAVRSGKENIETVPNGIRKQVARMVADKASIPDSDLKHMVSTPTQNLPRRVSDKASRGLRHVIHKVHS